MIRLTRLNGSEFTINAELIETVDAAPDGAIISLATNNRYNVREPVDAVVEKVIEYRKKVAAEPRAVNPVAGFERS